MSDKQSEISLVLLTFHAQNGRVFTHSMSGMRKKRGARFAIRVQLAGFSPWQPMPPDPLLAAVFLNDSVILLPLVAVMICP